MRKVSRVLYGEAISKFFKIKGSMGSNNKQHVGSLAWG